MPPKKRAQPEPEEYRPPTHDALIKFGFMPYQPEPNFLPTARAGCSGGTGGIWVYPGYLGSPKIELIYLSHGWFSCGPPGPNPEPNQKYRAANGQQMLAVLHECGYPTPAQIKELEAIEEARIAQDLMKEIAEENERLKKWERDCIWAKSNGNKPPIKPKFKHIQ